MNKKPTFIIGNGHGGVIDGIPQTKGKRSPDFGDGVLYEGESNRRIAKLVIEGLKKAKIPYIELVPELLDVSLRERVNRVNRIAKHKPCVYISLHSDGFTKESANGFSVYTSVGETKSDKVASIMYKYAEKAGLKIRKDWSDGDIDKEANFYVLKNTSCPAVLVENLFMTNKKDYEFLMSEKGQKVLAKIQVDSIKEIWSNGI